MTRIARGSGATSRRCLVIERHKWETGGNQQQLQFVLDVARVFFGPGNTDLSITANVFMAPLSPTPTFSRQVAISREYPNGTRRTNRFPEISGVPSSFIFFEETATPNTYDVWWQEDVAVAAALYTDWSQGKNSQYGRGRLSIIVPAPVPRLIERID